MPESQTPTTQTPFWSSRFGRAGKFALLVTLVATFVIQTYLAYTDPLKGETLSPIAQQGRHIWYANNCQSCHQLYGFGGFLGPDLTNAAPGLTPDRLNTILTEGSGTMPAFQMTPEDIEAVAAFLDAMDRTGRGEARALYGDGDPAQLLTTFETEVAAQLAATTPSPAAVGFDLVVARSCHTCHIPFRRYSNGGADLSRVAGRLTDDAVHHVLTNGKGTAMPKPSPELTSPERDAILAYLKWLGENRQQLLDALDMSDAGKIKWADIPWWDFQ